MDFDKERDFSDQGPLTDMEMEEDAEITSLLLKDLISCRDVVAEWSRRRAGDRLIASSNPTPTR